MRLVLVQHGEALAKDQDPDRPLSETGREDVGRLSRFLGQADRLPARVMHSGKTRARQSAEALSAGRAPEVHNGLGPKADTGAFAAEVAGWNHDTVIVGHQPFLGKLASRLLTGEEERVSVGFQPGSALCLERDDDGDWSVVWLVRPGLLRTQ